MAPADPTQARDAPATASAAVDLHEASASASASANANANANTTASANANATANATANADAASPTQQLPGDLLPAVWALVHRGGAMARAGDVASALQLLLQARRLLASYAATRDALPPAADAWMLADASACACLYEAAIHRTLHDCAAALAAFAAAERDLRTMARLRPHHPHVLLALASLMRHVGYLHAARGAPGDAVRAHEEGAAACRALLAAAAADTPRLRVMQLLALHLHDLGAIHAARAAWPAAESAATEAVRVCDRVCALAAGAPAHVIDLAAALMALGHVLRASGNAAAAVPTLRVAVARLRPVVRDAPAQQAAALMALAAAEHACGRPATALFHAYAAIRLLRQLGGMARELAAAQRQLAVYLAAAGYAAAAEHVRTAANKQGAGCP